MTEQSIRCKKEISILLAVYFIFLKFIMQKYENAFTLYLYWMFLGMVSSGKEETFNRVRAARAF